MYIQGSPVETQTPPHRSPIGRSMTAPLPVLSPSSILPPFRSHSLIGKFDARLNMTLFQFFNCCLKLPNLKFAYVAGCLCVYEIGGWDRMKLFIALCLHFAFDGHRRVRVHVR
jgi:hypothetical protein